MTTHTKGPLKTWKGAGEGDDYEPDRWCVVVDGPKPYLVATIENGQPGDTLETEAATARLFAAAPDLLAACKAWDEGFAEGEQFTPEQFRVWVNERRRMARAAIAKAEGRA